MFYSLFIVFIEVVVVLLVLKEGWLLQLLSNADVPFMDLVCSFFQNRDNLWAAIQPPGGVTKAFWVQLLSIMVYLCIFPLVSYACSMMLAVGKREDASLFRRAVSPFLIKVAELFFSALITAVIQMFVLEKLFGVFQGKNVLMVISGIGLPVLILVVLFFIVGAPAVSYALWILGRVVFTSTVKLIAIEFFLIFAYYMLNVPEMFEGVGTIVLMVIGMAACIGAVFGTNIFEKRMDQYINSSRGKHTNPVF